MRAGWTRRASLLVALAAPTWAAAAPVEPRVVSLDWAMTMSMLDLGVPPVGIAEQRLYAHWVGTPAIPPGIAEVGLRDAPSLETLVALRPDLILVNPLDTPLLARLERIAPTLMNTTFSVERMPLKRARGVLRDLAVRVGRSRQAEALIDAADAAIVAARRRVAPHGALPVIPLSAADGRHLTVYGPGSLYHDVLVAMGLSPGAVGTTGLWGQRTVAVPEMAGLLPAVLLVIAPLAPAARASLEGPGLWRALLAARGGRQVIVPACWAYGTAVSAGRFATLVADALTGAPA